MHGERVTYVLAQQAMASFQGFSIDKHLVLYVTLRNRNERGKHSQA